MLCECGCGEEVNPGRRFIFGHNRRGKKNSPEHCAAISDALKGIPLTPETRKKMSVAAKGVPKSPEHIAAISTGTKGVPKPPSHRMAIKKAREESGADEKQCGGNDIVWHHTLYDHSDLSKNRVAMTRSKHTMGHHVLRKLGIKILHINKEESCE